VGAAVEDQVAGVSAGGHLLGAGQHGQLLAAGAAALLRQRASVAGAAVAHHVTRVLLARQEFVAHLESTSNKRPTIIFSR